LTSHKASKSETPVPFAHKHHHQSVVIFALALTYHKASNLNDQDPFPTLIINHPLCCLTSHKASAHDTYILIYFTGQTLGISKITQLELVSIYEQNPNPWGKLISQKSSWEIPPEAIDSPLHQQIDWNSTPFSRWKIPKPSKASS
jgi:hypothetical protein